MLRTVRNEAGYCCLLATYYLLLPTYYLATLLPTCYMLITTPHVILNYWLLATSYWLLATDCPSDYQLSTDYLLLPTVYYYRLLPANRLRTAQAALHVIGMDATTMAVIPPGGVQVGKACHIRKGFPSRPKPRPPLPLGKKGSPPI